MKQIIVPTDFSKGAWNALLYAAGLAEALSIREILVINSFTAPHAGAATLVSIDKIMQQDSEEGLRELMGRIKESGLSARLNFHSKSVHAGLVEAISYKVEEYNTLVVMGSLGETGTVEKIFGSNASDVALNVHCPVLIIPPHVSFTNCDDVVLASDYDKVSERNLQILKAFYALDPSTKLQIVHVQEEEEDEADDVASMGLNQQNIPHVIKVIKGKNVSNALDDYVSNLKADLLVIIKKETGFIEGLFHRSVTKKLALLGHIPLLVLK